MSNEVQNVHPKGWWIKFVFAGAGVLAIAVATYFGIELPYATELVCGVLQQ